MSVAFNQGPAGLPLARLLVALSASRNRPTRRVSSGNPASRGANFVDEITEQTQVRHGRTPWRADDRGHALDITSAQNAKVKLMRTFHKRRTRDAEGKTLVEGHRLVCDLIEGGRTPSLVIVSQEALDASTGPRLRAALETLPAHVVALAAPEVVQRCCDTVTSQGVVALIEKPILSLPDTLRTLLVCDGIQDPGNLGTLIRTAKGLGVDAVILTGACADYWAPKTVRSAMGASFRIPSVTLESWEEVVDLMRRRGVRMYAAEGGATLSHFDADWTAPSALVVGAEARGLGDDARRDLESGEVVGVSVPLQGDVESLNAAVAGAIILGEAQRQRAMAERLVGGTGLGTGAHRARGLSTSAQ